MAFHLVSALVQGAGQGKLVQRAETAINGVWQFADMPHITASATAEAGYLAAC